MPQSRVKFTPPPVKPSAKELAGMRTRIANSGAAPINIPTRVLLQQRSEETAAFRMALRTYLRFIG